MDLLADAGPILEIAMQDGHARPKGKVTVTAGAYLHKRKVSRLRGNIDWLNGPCWLMCGDMQERNPLYSGCSWLRSAIGICVW